MFNANMKQIGIHCLTSAHSVSLPIYYLLKKQKYCGAILMACVSVSAAIIQLTQVDKDKSVISPKHLPLLRTIDTTLSLAIGYYGINMYLENPTSSILKLLFPIAGITAFCLSYLQRNKSKYYITHEIFHHLLNISMYLVTF